MLIPRILVGVAALSVAADATPFVHKGHQTSSVARHSSSSDRNNSSSTSVLEDSDVETLDGHYLSQYITDRTFFEGSCSEDTVAVRKEWRSMAAEEKTAFINAEKCMMRLQNSTSNPGALDRFSDFQAAHQQGTNQSDGDIIHYTAIFLQWHRAQLQVHEYALQTECNYTGTLPWWDEALDAQSGNFFQSDMWEDQYFGGNGNSIDSCVTTGSFANRTLHVGPLLTTTDYCFARSWNETKGLDYGARAHVDDCYAFDDFPSFYSCMAYYPHIAGHQATGGVMTDVDASPGDPIFYLHHNYVDRLYWQWQQINPDDRLYLIEGNTTIHEPATGWESLTLDSKLSMYGIADDIAIRDVQNVQGGYLCYSFDY